MHDEERSDHFLNMRIVVDRTGSQCVKNCVRLSITADLIVHFMFVDIKISPTDSRDDINNSPK